MSKIQLPQIEVFDASVDVKKVNAYIVRAYEETGNIPQVLIGPDGFVVVQTFRLIEYTDRRPKMVLPEIYERERQKIQEGIDNPFSFGKFLKNIFSK